MIINKRIVRLIVVTAIAFLFSFYVFLTPQGAIRTYVLLNNDPFQAITLRIKNNYQSANKSERLYYVQGVIDRKSGNSLGFFHLKQHKYGLWSVQATGSGP